MHCGVCGTYYMGGHRRSLSVSPPSVGPSLGAETPVNGNAPHGSALGEVPIVAGTVTENVTPIGLERNGIIPPPVPGSPVGVADAHVLGVREPPEEMDILYTDHTGAYRLHAKLNGDKYTAYDANGKAVVKDMDVATAESSKKSLEELRNTAQDFSSMRGINLFDKTNIYPKE